MWIASKLGFFSVVQKAAGEWHVRGRVRDDLANLVNAAYKRPEDVLGSIEEWPEADYRWRLIVRDADELAGLLQVLADSITYSNFKSEIAQIPGQQPKLPAYHQLWQSLHDLQDQQPT